MLHSPLARRAPLVAVACVCLGACGSGTPASAGVNTGGTVPPANSDEQQVLDRLEELPVGTPTRIGTTTVTAGASYAAASGRTCRRLQLSSVEGQPSFRLACTEGQDWVFVPNVFITPPDPEP